MKTFLLIALTAAAILGVASVPGPASAQIYINPGYGPGPYYREPYYRERYVPPRRYVRPRYVRPSYRSCRPGFTVQDGVCKPYRGY
jgi:hypothetical protein